MKLPNLKMLSVPPSPVRAMGGSQAGTKEVKICINPSPLRGKSVIQSHPKLLAIRVKTYQPGKLLVCAAGQEVEDAEDQLAAAPEAPRM